jgi:hypothetical protein
MKVTHECCNNSRQYLAAHKLGMNSLVPNYSPTLVQSERQPDAYRWRVRTLRGAWHVLVLYCPWCGVELEVERRRASELQLVGDGDA